LYLLPLTPNTTYYFRAKAVGDSTSYGIEKSFTTLTPPTVTTNDATDIGIDSARLNGTLDDLGTATSTKVSFEWGQTPGGPYPNETIPQVMSAPGAYSFYLTPLMSNTTYYFRAKAAGDSTSYGIEKSFTTLKPPAIFVPLVENDYDEPHHYFLDINAFEFNRQFRINVNGRMLETADVTCSDGLLNIHIPIGTVVNDEYGDRPSALEIEVIKSPLKSSDDMYFIGPAYILLPDSTTFNPSITLTWIYNPDDLPEDIQEEELFLASYDENTGEWIKLDCVLDTVNHTITAEFSHSMTFAVFCAKPESAPLTVGNLVESPSGNVAGLEEPPVVQEVVSTSNQQPTSPNPSAPKNNSWQLAIGIVIAEVVVGIGLYLFITKRRKV
jgi:hypothetical protein